MLVLNVLLHVYINLLFKSVSESFSMFLPSNGQASRHEPDTCDAACTKDCGAVRRAQGAACAMGCGAARRALGTARDRDTSGSLANPGEIPRGRRWRDRVLYGGPGFHAPPGAAAGHGATGRPISPPSSPLTCTQGMRKWVPSPTGAGRMPDTRSYITARSPPSTAKIGREMRERGERNTAGTGACVSGGCVFLLLWRRQGIALGAHVHAGTRAVCVQRGRRGGAPCAWPPAPAMGK